MPKVLETCLNFNNMWDNVYKMKFGGYLVHMQPYVVILSPENHDYITVTLSSHPLSNIFKGGVEGFK